jgi:hypothetical protein
MDADLNGSVTGNGRDLEGAGNEFALHLAAEMGDSCKPQWVTVTLTVPTSTMYEELESVALT